MAIFSIIQNTKCKMLSQEQRMLKQEFPNKKIPEVGSCITSTKIVLETLSFLKTYKFKSSGCLFNLIPSSNKTYSEMDIMVLNAIPSILLSKNYFFPSTILDLSKLDFNIKNFTALTIFTFICYIPKETEYITLSRLGLSHLAKIDLNTVFKICQTRHSNTPFTPLFYL